jgi:hypothetical protein
MAALALRTFTPAILLAGALFASNVASSAVLLLQVQSFGGGTTTFYSRFELRADGHLAMTRTSPSGQVIERRRAQLDDETMSALTDLILAGGYASQTRKELRHPTVSRALTEVADLAAWRIEGYREGKEAASAVIPYEYLRQFHPELVEIEFVRAGWELVRALRSQWETAEASEQ